MGFTKIKHSKSDTELGWKDSAPGKTIEHRLTSSEEPRQALIDALQSFTRYVLDLCDLPATYIEGLTISGVNISQSDLQGRGIVVTALKKLPGCGAPLVLNTPHLTETASFAAGPQLPSYAVQLLNTLEAEAAAFRSGDRAQADMFEGLRPRGSVESVTLSAGGRTVTLHGKDR